MLSFQLNPIAPSTTTKMNELIVHKTFTGRVMKKTRKTATSPKKQVSSLDEIMCSSNSTSATSPNRPNRLVHCPLSKQQAALLLGIKTSLMKSRNSLERVEPKEDQMDLDKKIEYPTKMNTSGGIKTKKPEKPLFESKFAKDTTFSGVVKNRKEAKPVLISKFSKCPKFPSAISESRILLRSNGKGLVTLGLEVVRFGVANVLKSLESDLMDTREDYDWNYDGFNGYLLEERNAKRAQFPEMDLGPETSLLYYKGEVNEYGIA